jgi:hypothetical protein
MHQATERVEVVNNRRHRKLWPLIKRAKRGMTLTHTSANYPKLGNTWRGVVLARTGWIADFGVNTWVSKEIRS